MKKILILSLCFITLVGCGCKNKKNETKEEQVDFKVNFNISKEKEVDGLKFSNVQLFVDNSGLSTYKAVVTNTTDRTYELNQISIRIVNKEEQEIATLMAYVGSSIAPGESRNIDTSIEQDLMSGYEVYYDIKK